MAFLLKLKRADLQMIAEELGVEFTEDDTKIQLRKKIMGSNDYEERVIMELSNTVVAELLELEKGKTEKIEREKLEKQEKIEDEKLEKQEKIEREKLEREERREKLEREERVEKFRMEYELEMERLKIQDSANNSNGTRLGT